MSTVSGQALKEQTVNDASTVSLPAMASAPERGHVIQKVEKQTRAHEDLINQLLDQAPQPCADRIPTNHIALEACALMA